MDPIHLMMIHFFILLFIHGSNSIFIPDRNDHNAYGMKIAMNDVLFVQVHPAQQSTHIFYTICSLQLPLKNHWNAPLSIPRFV